MIRRTASATAASHCGPVRPPSAYEMVRGATGGVTGGSASSCTNEVPIWVSQARPLRRPSTVLGTTMVDRAAVVAGSNTKLPKAMNPAPGVWSRSLTDTTWAIRPVHHSSASATDPGLLRTTSPQPIMPSPRRTQAYASRLGSREASGPGSSISTVRA